MIEHAVILAAGLGTRLQDHWNEQPKGLIPLAGVSLMERSIAQLEAVGIRDITVVTGHLSFHYEDLAKRMPSIHCVHNPDFARTGSYASLCAGAARVRGPFLLLESDLLYEPSALSALLEHPHPDLVLAGRSPMHDKVFVQCDPGGRLTGLGKDPDTAPSSCGELVGISKISPDLALRLLSMRGPATATQDYETALVRAAAGLDLRVLVRPDLAWCEIDDARHLEKAMTEVWPHIQRKAFHVHPA